jgi:hypothetical protein
MIRYRDAAGIVSIGAREFEGIAATSDLQPDGISLLMSGANLSRFVGGKGPLIWSHDPNTVLGRIKSIRTTGSALKFVAAFASEGISLAADEKCGLLKDGVLNSISLGFQVDECEPIDPARPRNGVRATAWTVFEISLVGIAMDPAAVVTARAARLARRTPGEDAPAQSATGQRLAVIAAEAGEVLTPARAAEIIRQARELGRTPEYHLRWTYLAAGVYEGQHADFQRRQAAVAELARAGR